MLVSNYIEADRRYGETHRARMRRNDLRSRKRTTEKNTTIVAERAFPVAVGYYVFQLETSKNLLLLPFAVNRIKQIVLNVILNSEESNDQSVPRRRFISVFIRISFRYLCF